MIRTGCRLAKSIDKILVMQSCYHNVEKKTYHYQELSKALCSLQAWHRSGQLYAWWRRQHTTQGSWKWPSGPHRCHHLLHHLHHRYRHRHLHQPLRYLLPLLLLHGGRGIYTSSMWLESQVYLQVLSTGVRSSLQQIFLSSYLRHPVLSVAQKFILLLWNW